MASNFRQLDLNLLRVLCAVYRTGSVTEAGRQLALSQPATSNALARLRSHFGDELFVRSPRGLHPTRLAQRIAPELIAQLRALEATVTASDTFEAPSSHEHWRLSMSDLGEMMFLPALARALREHAPHCRLSNLPVPAPQVGAALVAHEIDLAIGILQPGPRGIDHELLFEEPFVALSGAHWIPPAGACGATLTVAQLACSPLALASPVATFHDGIDRLLDRLGLDGAAVLRVRHYAALPDIVSSSDLLAVVPQAFARSLGTRWALRVWALPDAGPHYAVRMMWHASATGDPAHSWLRARVRELFSRPAAASD